MRPEALARVAFASDPGPALETVPAAPGVGQILGPEGRNLLIGTASNLRRWAASHLGLGRPRPAEAAARGARRPASRGSRRPSRGSRRTGRSASGSPTSGWRRRSCPPPRGATSSRRPSSTSTPPSASRGSRVRATGEHALYGPFRDRRAAEKARGVLQRQFSLRPCDFSFEPDPALPLGLACLYAQVRSCAAPCLARVSEADYRTLATDAAGWLFASGAPRGGGPRPRDRGVRCRPRPDRRRGQAPRGPLPRARRARARRRRTRGAGRGARRGRFPAGVARVRGGAGLAVAHGVAARLEGASRRSWSWPTRGRQRSSAQRCAPRCRRPSPLPRRVVT